MFDGGSVEEHPVLCAPAALAAVASGVLGSSGLSLTLPEVRTALTDLVRAQAVVDAARLHLVRMLLDREDPGDPDGACVHWMTHALRTGRAQARADVAAARATDPTDGVLPSLGAALASGEAHRAHVDVAVRALHHLPTGLVAGRGEDLDALLTDHARSFSPPDAKTLATHLIATAAPDGLDAFEDHAHERRSWDVRVDRTGMVAATGQLDPAGGATYLAVLGPPRLPQHHQRDRQRHRRRRAAAAGPRPADPGPAPRRRPGPDGTPGRHRPRPPIPHHRAAPRGHPLHPRTAHPPPPSCGRW